MAFRFRKSIRLVPGVRLNLGRKSASVSLGIRGFSKTIGTKESRTTVGIPGTGLSWSAVSQRRKADPGTEAPIQGNRNNKLFAGALVVLGLVAWAVSSITGGSQKQAPPVPPAATVAQPLPKQISAPPAPTAVALPTSAVSAAVPSSPVKPPIPIPRAKPVQKSSSAPLNIVPSR